MGTKGWNTVLGAAASLAGLTAVAPLGAAWRGLIEGRLESLDVSGKLREEGLAGVVAAGYLGRSASILTRLDMRCPPLARWRRRDAPSAEPPWAVWARMAAARLL